MRYTLFIPEAVAWPWRAAIGALTCATEMGIITALTSDANSTDDQYERSINPPKSQCWSIVLCLVGDEMLKPSALELWTFMMIVQ